MSPLSRTLVILGFAVFLLLCGGWLLWYLAYGVVEAPPETVRLSSLSTPAEITWGAEGNVAIRAGTEADAWTALGYAHGRRRSWSVALWRQAAMGCLGEWFGAKALPMDQLTRRLGLADLAQASYQRLDDDSRQLLDAYAHGLNTALQRPDGRLRQEFVLLGLEPDPWEPWHTLALERLFMWLATPPPPPAQLAAADTAITAFYRADGMLRSWLRLHGFENSVAWAASDSMGTHLFYRFVYGATALPVLVEASMQWSDSTTIAGASLPGTPFFPFGHTEHTAWALLLTGSAELTRTLADSSALALTFQRIKLHDGEEHLLSFFRLPNHLPLTLPADTSAADSVWAIHWNGLTPGTDLAAWIDLLHGESGSFTQFTGSGLQMDQSGTWQVLGSPPIASQLPDGIFIGANEWSVYAAELLRTQESGAVQLNTWIDDTYSIWAAQAAPPLVAELGRVPLSTPTQVEALTYLRNWDFSYDGASIAASIFDTWLAVYQSTTGTLPALSAPDTTRLDPRHLTAFQQAVDTLAARFGEDLRQWRWENVQPDERLFPIWSVEDLQEGPVSLRASERFAPLIFPGSGHPSTLAWGPSPIQQALPAPSAWEAWVRTDTWGQLTIRRRTLNHYAMLGRYAISDRPPHSFTLPSPASNRPVTTLHPGS